jgi:anti-sigma regulatory factor (Ser/Thr protein kinase)
LCVSELVTNAVIHTGTTGELTARLHADMLTVSVRDSVVRAELFHDPLTMAGRGLSLVEALTTAWATERCADGTTVRRAPCRRSRPTIQARLM